MMDLSEGFHEENLQTLSSGSASAIPAVQPSEQRLQILLEAFPLSSNSPRLALLGIPLF